MENDEDLSAFATTEFSVNQETALIESNNPKIFLRGRGATPEPHVRYFTLYWGDRQIGIRCTEHPLAIGRSADGQPVSEMHWIVEEIGGGGGPINERCAPYTFGFREERIIAAQLIIKALSVYGGAFDAPQYNYFPVFRNVTARLSENLKKITYGGVN